MICKYCGHELADNSKFCIFCGNIIQHPEEMPVKIIQNKPSEEPEDPFKEYKPKHGVRMEAVPEIDIIDIKKDTAEKEPMKHNAEKLKLIQDFDASAKEIVEPDKEEILGAITHKEEKLNPVGSEIQETAFIESVNVEEPKEEQKKEIKPKKPEIVYLGNKFNFSGNKENKVLNILIITFAVLAVILALKTFVF